MSENLENCPQWTISVVCVLEFKLIKLFLNVVCLLQSTFLYKPIFLLILEKYKAHVRCNWLGVKVVTIELETFSFRLSRYSLNEDITY